MDVKCPEHGSRIPDEIDDKNSKKGTQHTDEYTEAISMDDVCD